MKPGPQLASASADGASDAWGEWQIPEMNRFTVDNRHQVCDSWLNNLFTLFFVEHHSSPWRCSLHVLPMQSHLADALRASLAVPWGPCSTRRSRSDNSAAPLLLMVQVGFFGTDGAYALSHLTAEMLGHVLRVGVLGAGADPDDEDPK